MKVLFASVLFFVSLNSWADSFYVEDVKGSDISVQDKNSIRELIRLSVSQSGTHKVVSQLGSATWILSSQLLKLGDAYILNLEKKSADGKNVFSEKMKSSMMSNMDVTVQRLVTAVISEKSFSQTADVTNITDEEKKQNINRIEATRQWVIGLGPSWSSNLNSAGKGGFTLLIGYEWGLDPDYSVTLSYLAHSGRGDDDSRFGDFSVAGTYYFSRTKISPFVTAGIGYGSGDVNDGCSYFCTTSTTKDPSGWSTNVAAGAKFFRTSSVNISAFVRYTQLFDSATLGSPSLTSAMVAVHY